MTPQENDLDLFAMVRDGKVVEYPVYRLHIRNRAHPIEWYSRVTEHEKPELPPFHYHETKIEMINGVVHVSYPATPYTLSQLLSQLKTESDDPAQESQPMSIGDVDPAMVQHLYGLTSNYVHAKLDEFAQTRGYNNLDSLLGKYTNSTIPKFAMEAARGRLLLDTAWTNLLTYFDGIMAGTTPVPTSMLDIDANLPPLTWEDEV